MQTIGERYLPHYLRTYFKVYTSRGIILSLLAVLLIGASTTIMQLRSVNELKRLADQQQGVASNTYLLNDILSATVDAETGQRGYLLTGNPTYLASYNTALPQINKDFKNLRRMPQSAKDTAAISTLQNTVTQKLAELSSTLSAMNSGGLSSAAAIVNTNRGLVLMNSIRSQVGTIERRQGGDVSQSRTHVLAQINTFQNILIAIRLSALILVAMGMYLIGKALYDRYELERSKGEFIDIAAHQLRTPASVIKLHLAAMIGGYTGKLTSKQMAVARKAYESNEHSIQIIEDVLKVAKIDNGDTVLHARLENLQRVIDDAAAAIQPSLKMRKQKLVRKVPKQPVDANLDAMYVRMVIENLLDNASKYSRDGSTITVGLLTGEKWNLIYVEDHGVGIARRDKAKLFKKFSRIESDISDNITGSGLGLYWAQKIAELHGGKIQVKSKKRVGSTFTLELPIHESLSQATTGVSLTDRNVLS